MRYLITFIAFVSCVSVGMANPQSTAESSQAISETTKAQIQHIFRKRNEQEQLDGQALANWQQQLNNQLIQSQNPYFQTLAVAYLISHFTNSQLISQLGDDGSPIPDDAVDWSAIGNQMNQLIREDEAGSETLSLLDPLCFHRLLVHHCDQSTLIERRMQATPDNLIAYFRPLALAVEAQNDDLVKRLIQLMAQAKTSLLPTSLKPQFHEFIDEYIAENPFSDAAIRAIAEEYRQVPSGLSEQAKNQMDQLMPVAMSGQIKSSHAYSTEIPPMRPLLMLCQQNQSFGKPCLKIAATMINHSDNLQSVAVGHALAMAVYEKNNQPEQLQTITQAFEAHKAMRKCLSDAAKGTHFIDDYFDQEHQNLVFSDGDELARLKKLAEHQFQKQQAAGNDNAPNPAACFTQS